jgi:hypothetical protein
MLFGLFSGLRMASGNRQAVLKNSGHGAGWGANTSASALIGIMLALAAVALISAYLHPQEYPIFNRWLHYAFSKVAFEDCSCDAKPEDSRFSFP